MTTDSDCDDWPPDTDYRPDDADLAAWYEEQAQRLLADAEDAAYQPDPAPPPAPCICRPSRDPTRLALALNCPRHGFPALPAGGHRPARQRDRPSSIDAHDWSAD